MGQVVLRGSREQLIAYLKRYPKVRQLTLIVTEDESETSAHEHPERVFPEGIRERNGVPLFSNIPNMTPVTVEMVNQLLNEENASSD